MSRVADFYPLTPMQAGMLFHTLYAPDSGVYVTQVHLGFGAGELDLPAFAESWQRVVERHAVLRTFFLWEGLEAPIQAVEREAVLPIERLDWGHLSPAEARERLAAYQHAERTRRFDLARAPLARLGLIQLPGGTCQVVWSFHHILLDGRSVALVLQDVETIYRARAAGREPGLPPVRPFRDYVVWLKRQDLAPAEAHWRGVLCGFTAPTPLPADRQEGRGGAPAGHAEQRGALTAEATAALSAWARRAGLTLNTLAQGAWAILLSRYSGQRDIAFGAAVLGRPDDLEGADSIVGLFVNTLLLRLGVAPDAPLVPWLQELQASWSRSRRFEHSPLVEVQAWSEVPRGAPLFESILNFTQGGRPAARMAEVETVAQTHVAMTLDVVVGAELELRLHYDRARFGDAAMALLLGHLTHLLTALPGEPRRRLSDLPLWSVAERQALTLEWNDTAVRRPEPALLHAPCEAWAAATPDAVALVSGAGALSYGELDALAGRLARRLRAQGVRPESRVGILMERSTEMVVALLAVAKAGGAYLPLDPEHPAERLAFLAADGQVSLVLVTRGPDRPLPLSEAPVLEVDLARLRAEPGGTAPVCGATSDGLAYVIYTSGSTGRPKGVMVSHRAIANRLDWQEEAFPLATGGRVLQKTPFSFDVSVWELFWPLSNGACLVLAPPGAQRDPAHLLDLIARERITHVHFVPSLLHFFLETPGIEAASCLERVICSGEALGADLAERCHDCLPAALHNLYGPTEAAVDVTAWQCERGESRSTVPIGRPIANTHARLLDSGPWPVPSGAVGELCLGGVGLARGYLGRPDLTAERFVPDPFASIPGERLYRTGDLARWRPDGTIDYLGRIDLQLKVRGIRVEPGEIEEVLASHPSVRQAAVGAAEDGPAGRRLIAWIVPAPGATPTGEELRAFARGKLPEAMVPSAVVPLGALPLTLSGKLDRKALPAPSPATATGERGEPEPPRDEIESALVEMWEEVLSVRPIGIRDDFFALGGHSLLAVRLVGMLQKRFQKRLPLSLFVERRTIERLAPALRHPAGRERRSPLVALQPRGDRPPFFCVHPIGGQVLCYADLARHLGTDQPVYGVEAPGLAEVGETAPSIEEMAASYLGAVRAVQPAGPYFFGGWSMGGILAFEMARQLSGSGEEAALVAIVDSWSPAIHRIVPDDAYLLAELVRDHALQQGLPPSLTYERLRQLPPEARLERVLAESQRAGMVSADVDVSWVRHSLAGYRARREALSRYRPTRYQGRLVLFRAALKDKAFLRTLKTEVGIDVRDPLLGWGAFSTEAVAVEEIPGHHSTLCQEPNVQTLARSLRSWIAPALRGEEVRSNASSGGYS